MKHAIQIANYADFGDIQTLIDLAQHAEAQGWDGFYLWDSMTPDAPMAELITALAAIAASTEDIRIGPMVMVLPQRRPWVVARQTTTIDRLSGGRLTYGVGIGDEETYEMFGEPGTAKSHGEMLDEELAILVGLWSGEAFSFAGKYYSIDEVRFQPGPVQKPRIPIWTAGRWPYKKPFRRAAQWDGIFPYRADMSRLSPEEIVEIRAYIDEHRSSDDPFDIAIAMRDHKGGSDIPYSDAHVKDLRTYEKAGVTWAIESIWPTASLVDARTIIAQGPPVV